MRSDMHLVPIERPRGIPHRETRRGTLRGKGFTAEIGLRRRDEKRRKTPFGLQWQGQRFVVLRKRSLHSTERHDYGLKDDVDA